MRAPMAQRGVALLLVLWACTLLAIVLGGLAALARTEGLQARYQLAYTQAHYAAEAGLMRAVYGLQDPQPKRRWVADGRPYQFHFDQAQVQVRAVSESGKVDLNAATPGVLEGLFVAAGEAPDRATRLAAQVVAWRSAANAGASAAVGDAAYAAAGRDYGPRHAPFASVGELQLVLDMTPALYRRIGNDISIYGGNATPDPNTATPLALAAIPGMDPAQLQAIHAARQHNATDTDVVMNNGSTHSIESQATLVDGTRAMLRATIRLQAGAGGGQSQPYVVLRWREGVEQ